MGCLRGNLGEVGDADHLTVLAELLELFTDDRSGCPADVGIDLFEDEGRGVILFSEGNFNSKEQTRELTTAGMIFNEHRMFTRIRFHPELDEIIAVRAAG